MARKVFISVLGTGKYSNCIYVKGNEFQLSTPYIQHATLKLIKAEDWDKTSVGYILLTEKARSENWDKSGTLSDILNDLSLPFPIYPIDIPNGKNEDEMWNLFEITFNLLNEGDELYFDVTHGFRYLPMFILVLGNYAKFLKHIKVRSITYGNWEARNPNTNEAPIMNLLPLSSLQDWTFATANYLENGYADKLLSLSKEQIKEAYLNNTLPKKHDVNLKEYFDSLNFMLTERQTCRGLNIITSEKVNEVSISTDLIMERVKPHFKPLFKEIKKSIQLFKPSNDIHNTFSAARWCLDKHLYQQAITFIREGTISKICDSLSIYDIDDRELVPRAFKLRGKEIENNIITQKNVWERYNDHDRALIKKILRSSFCANTKLVNAVNSMIDLRNDYNHCGMKKEPLNSKKIISGIDNYLKLIEDNIFNGLEFRERIFLNLSNHPSEQWSDKQLAAAREYGDIEDMEFPDIPPGATGEELMNFAEKTAEEILQKAENADITVHVMGEMTFTYRLVSLLKAEGITCVASTTERIVEEKDGLKTSEFRFIKFREY